MSKQYLYTMFRLVFFVKTHIMNEILSLLIFSMAAVLSLFLISKILGKKQIAQLEFIDYVLGISIGSIAAEMATDISDKPFYYYLISMALFFFFDMAVTFLGRKKTCFKKFFKGRPLIIINDGKVDFGELKRSKLDFYDLLSLCRENGFFNIEDISYAVFETSGKMSVLPKSEMKPVVISDIGKSVPPLYFPYYLIVDGEIIEEGLKETEKSREWLLKKLGASKKELKKILYVRYDKTNDDLIVVKKNA